MACTAVGLAIVNRRMIISERFAKNPLTESAESIAIGPSPLVSTPVWSEGYPRIAIEAKHPEVVKE